MRQKSRFLFLLFGTDFNECGCDVGEKIFCEHYKCDVKRPQVAKDLLVSHFPPGTLVTTGQAMYVSIK